MTRLCALREPCLASLSYVSFLPLSLSQLLLPQHSVLGNDVVLLSLQTFPQLVAAAHFLLWFLWRATTCRCICLGRKLSLLGQDLGRGTIDASYVVGINCIISGASLSSRRCTVVSRRCLFVSKGLAAKESKFALRLRHDNETGPWSVQASAHPQTVGIEGHCWRSPILGSHAACRDS